MTILVTAEFAKQMMPKLKQRWRRFYTQKTKAPKRPRKRKDIMSKAYDRKLVKQTVRALNAAADEMWGGFTWDASPEGHTYWALQVKHIEALANQIDSDRDAYLDHTDE